MADLSWQKIWHDIFTDEAPDYKSLKGISAAGSATCEKILSHYRWANRENLKEVLIDKYEVVFKLINNPGLIDQYIENHPSQFNSVDEYGKDFESYLELHKYPDHILELSRIEKVIYSFGFDVKQNHLGVDWNSISSTSKLYLQNAILYKSHYDVARMWNQEKELSDKGDFYSILYYSETQTRVLTLQEWEYDILKKFEAGSSLEEIDTDKLTAVSPKKISELFEFMKNYLLLKKG